MKQKKYITSSEVALLMGVPLVTVSRWAHQGKIPCRLNGQEYQFSRMKIISWARSHQLYIQETVAPVGTPKPSAVFGLREAIERGGIYHHVPGHDIYSALENAVALLKLPPGFDREEILNELVNREEIASTGIGNGVAIPHPRKPFDLSLMDPVIAVFFLKEEIDFNSVDGKPVTALFVIFSPTTKIHLKLLAKLSYCLRDKKFLSLIREQADGESLLNSISDFESQMEKN
jgi:PTS system nitrogen regulatory IIA component